MRPKDYTVRATQVTACLTAHLAAALQLRDYAASVPARLLARLLLLCAANRRSLSFNAQHCEHAPSAESVRLALRHNLPDTALALLQRLRAALHGLLPARLARRPRPCALDLHLRPYYGDKDTPGVTGGQRAAGADYFWGYGTLAVLTKGLRLTVGLCPVDRQKSLVAVVQALVEQAREAGLTIAWLLLDRGFYDAQVVRYLQGQRVPFALPMIRRGDPEQGTGTRRFFGEDCAAGWHDYSWVARPWQRDPQTGRRKRQPGFEVSVRVCVYRPGAGERPWVFIAWGLNWEPGLLARRYRRRFGIETSYRQLGECLAATTSKDERVRLLYVGLALLVRQGWAWLHAEVLAAREGRCRRLRPGLLRLGCLVVWLTQVLVGELGFRMEVGSPNPLPQYPWEQG